MSTVQTRKPAPASVPADTLLRVMYELHKAGLPIVPGVSFDVARQKRWDWIPEYVLRARCHGAADVAPLHSAPKMLDGLVTVLEPGDPDPWEKLREGIAECKVNGWIEAQNVGSVWPGKCTRPDGRVITVTHSYSDPEAPRGGPLPAALVGKKIITIECKVDWLAIETIRGVLSPDVFGVHYRLTSAGVARLREIEAAATLPPAGEGEGDTQIKRASRKETSKEKAARALVLLEKNPELTYDQVADLVGVTRGTLWRNPLFRKGAPGLRRGKESRLASGGFRRGRDGETVLDAEDYREKNPGA